MESARLRRRRKSPTWRQCVRSFAGNAPPLDGYPLGGGSILFLGRHDRPRGASTSLSPGAAEAKSWNRVCRCGCWWWVAAMSARCAAGPDCPRRTSGVPRPESIDATKAPRHYRSVGVAPQPPGGESFGVVLVEGGGRGCRRRGQRPPRVPARPRRRAGRSPGYRIGRGLATRRHRAARRRHRPHAELVAAPRPGGGTTGRGSPTESCGCMRRSPSARAHHHFRLIN